MGLSRAGRLVVGPNRRVTSNDSSYPTGDSPSGAIEVPDSARGAITHVWVTITGSAASPSAIVTILGLPFESGESNEFDSTHQGIWLPLAVLNSSAAITQTSICPTAPASNVAYYTEPLLHISAYKKLCAYVTSMTNTSQVDAQFAFEAL